MSALTLKLPRILLRTIPKYTTNFSRNFIKYSQKNKNNFFNKIKNPLILSTCGIFSYHYINTFTNVLADEHKHGGHIHGHDDHWQDPDDGDEHFHLLDQLKQLAPVIDAKIMLKKFVHDIKKAGGNIDELHLDCEFLKELFREAGIQDDNVAEHVFHVMDWNKSGTLEACEFAAVFTLFQVGNDITRFQFLFRCLDLDGNGTVDKNEFRNVLTALFEAKYRLAGLHDDKDPDEWFHGMTVEDYHAIAKLKSNMLVRTIFAWADQNRDGELNIKEFLHWCKRGGYEVNVVKNLLTQTMGGTHSEHHHGRAGHRH